MKNLAWTLGLLVTLFACGDSASDDGSDGPADGFPPSGLTADRLVVRTDEFAIPPGDQFECHWTNITTPTDLYINGSRGKQIQGGHHITVYYTNVPKAPGHHPCNEAEMATWRLVAGSAGDDKPGEGIATLPDNGAFAVPAGKQIVIQTHYINTTGKEMRGSDVVEVKLIKKELAKYIANAYVVADTKFSLPPVSKFERTSNCVTNRDLNIVLMLGHMHEFGEEFTLDRVDEKGQVIENLIHNKWEQAFTSHPPLRTWSSDNPLKLPKGTRLRQTCKWNNTSQDSLGFPREMCVAFAFYYPDDGFLECDIETPAVKD